MRAILGIDAAWTEGEPSGVALLVEAERQWTCVAVAPSYESFIGLAGGRPVDWDARPIGSKRPPVRDLVVAAERLAGCDVHVVAVDMPMSHDTITCRRHADDAVSREFGGRHCAVHSPNRERPGQLGADITGAFTQLGFSLATTVTPHPEGRTLLEVYPHTALLSLLEVERRVPYKVSKPSKLWPHASVTERIDAVLKISAPSDARLECEFGTLPFAIPATARSLSDLKRQEDALDAVISAWMGTLYLAGLATPLGDEAAAIWVPTDTIRNSGGACPLCTSIASRQHLATNAAAVAFADGFPVSPGHTLIVSRRHVASMFELTADEVAAIWALVPAVKAAIEQAHQPTAYNIGVNVGRDAGQTVGHVHVHVIPRYGGDVEDPRGGVRWVIPAKADYWSAPR